jgi:D-psicose/D-tagatose/L-ribulose 3-epimerase
VWVGGWQKTDIQKAVQGTKRAGYDLIEVNVSVPEEIDAQLTKQILQENGVGATASMGLGLQHDISSEDNEVVKAGTEHLTNCLQKVHDLGGKYLVGVNYCAMTKYPGPASQQGRQNCANALKELTSRAADMGITYGLEVVNRYETNIANTGAQAMDLIDAVGNPDNLVVHLDTYHMNIEEASSDHAIGVCGDKLGYIHIGESHRGYLGTGSIDWKAFWQALAKYKYQGPITFESFSSAVVSGSLSNTLCVWRNLWEDSEDLATSANEFMRSGYKAAYKLPQP